MPLATLADAPQFDLGALRIRPLAVPSRGSRELSCWRVDLPPGNSSGAHTVDKEQLVIVHDGTLTALIGPERLVAGPGDALVLPVDTTVEMRNDSPHATSATVLATVGFKATAGGRTFAPPWSL